MNVKVEDLMAKQPITSVPHKSAGHIKEIMTDNHIHCVPILGPDKEVVGIVSSNDFLEDVNESTPVSKLMTEKVYTVPAYQDAHIAARIMRNHKIHHLVVTHENEIVGVLSSFDLLKLVEEHRYIPKNGPSKSKKENHRV